MKTLLFVSAAALIAATASTASAQLTISKFTIDAGGGTVASGPTTLGSSFGQPDATNPLAAGSFTLIGGFWGATTGCAACPADYNSDGAPDSDDIILFFADWEQGEGCADTDNDDDVDSDDVMIFFAQWEQGGC